jgi:hypothetical protein
MRDAVPVRSKRNLNQQVDGSSIQAAEGTQQRIRKKGIRLKSVHDSQLHGLVYDEDASALAVGLFMTLDTKP